VPVLPSDASFIFQRYSRLQASSCNGSHCCFAPYENHVMKLVYFRGDNPNFGDELSPLLWNALLPPGFLDENADQLLLGVGSILWDHLPAAPLKHVLGSGYGGYSGAPNVHDGRWNVVFVRGPQTAAKLGLAAEKAICDAAVLLRLTTLPPAARDIGLAFMPHCASMG